MNEIADSEGTRIPALIVDDEVLAGLAMKPLVERKGFDVQIVTDALEFPSVYRLSTELIILDLNMPGMDGIELLRFLSDNQSKAAIVLISGAQENILRAAFDLGVSKGLRILGALKKPVAGADLRRLLDAFQQLKAHSSTAGQLPRDGQSHSFPIEGSMELPSLDELREAIQQKQLDVYFQPKIGVADQNFAGVETLVRWQHPEKGFVPPDYFVQFAEKYGLIDDLTDLVIELACNHCRALAQIAPPFEVSINISEHSLGDLNLPERLEKSFKDGEMDPSSIVLEITETSFSSDPKNQLDILTRLRLKGFQVSIDDFGTGHSSLARLRQIPFSELKIDKMFVGACDTDSECRVIVANTIELAEELGLGIVAEGVENHAQFEFLRAFGCGKIQGYFFSKPLPCKEFGDWLAQWNKDHKAA